MSRRIRVLAPAKVNLTLEVLGRRADGYHEIRSVMATVGLYDDVRVAPARDLDVRLRPPLPDAGEDLCAGAARTLAEAAGRPPGLHVLVRKRIPLAAGLGGGSSDAAAVLRAAARLWDTRGPDLVALSSRVGSDVPFFASGAAVASIAGRGESVSVLPAPAEPLWIALVRVGARLATAEVFARVDGAGRGSATAALADLFRRGAADARAVSELLRNDLTPAAEHLCPALAEARARAKERGIDLALSGSGPTLFALADDRAHAIALARSLRRLGLRARAHAICVAAQALP